MNFREISDAFINPMRRQFVVPQGLPEDGFLLDLAESLEAYSAHQLAEAAKWFRENRTTRTFPTAAECRQTCGRFAASPAVLSSRKSSYVSDEEKRSEAIARRQRYDEAIRICQQSSLSWQARQEGWLNALLEFASDNSRMPNSREASEIKAKSEQVDDNLHRSPRPIMYTKLVELRREMKARAARHIFGEDDLERTLSVLFEPGRDGEESSGRLSPSVFASEQQIERHESRLEILKSQPLPMLSDEAKRAAKLIP
jgi:hypothetical protein